MNENNLLNNDSSIAKKKSNLWKWILGGCGCGCLIIVIALSIASYMGVKFVKAKIDQYRQEFTSQGFAEVKSQIINVREEVYEKKLFLGQVVKIAADCHTDIAIVAQSAEVFSNIDGTLYFRGQMLVIQPNAKISGNIDVKAQVVQIFGEVDGEIKGTYSQLIDNRKK